MAKEIIPIRTAAELQPNPPARIKSHPVGVYIMRLAAGSQRSMYQVLDMVARLLTNDQCDVASLPWADLRYEHTAAVRAALVERYKPATVNKALAAIRGVLKECWRLGYMPADQYRRAVDLPCVKSQTLPRGRALGSGEIASLMAACAKDPSIAGDRDAALIAVLYGCGLRRAEVVALQVGDVCESSGEVHVLAGKGRKDRVTYLSDGAGQAVNQWLKIRTTVPGPMFVPINRASRITYRRLTEQAILSILVKRGEQAGVVHFSPHDLRRSFITNLLDAGADTFVTQQLAGHSDPKTTKQYDRRGDIAKRNAAQLLHVPYFRRAS